MVDSQSMILFTYHFNKKNRLKMINLVRDAAENGAKFIVLPEAAITGFFFIKLIINYKICVIYYYDTVYFNAHFENMRYFSR